MRFLLYGSREFAATVGELVRHCGHEVVGTVDDYCASPGVLGGLEDVCHTHPPSKFCFAIAIGYRDLQARWRAIERVIGQGYDLPALVHPRAYVADSAMLNAGSLVMASASIDVRASVGCASVIWPGAIVSHDSAIGDNVFLSPGAVVCGATRVGSHTFVGAGAVVVDHADVPASSRIKMLQAWKG